MDDTLLGEGKKKEPCCFLFKYNFAAWSRGLAALSVILLILVSVLTISQGLESSLVGFVTSGIVILVELPMCCKCCCSKTVDKLKWMEATKENPKGCLIRAILYLLFCMAGSATCVKVNHNDIILLLVFILLGVDGLAYLMAFFQGTGSTSNSTLSRAAKKAAEKRATQYARDNPDKMEDFADSAVKYAIDNPDAAASLARGAIGGADVESASATAWDNADDDWSG